MYYYMYHRVLTSARFPGIYSTMVVWVTLRAVRRMSRNLEDDKQHDRKGAYYKSIRMRHDEPLPRQPGCNRWNVVDGAHAGIIQRFHWDTNLYHNSRRCR
jgi:hypothetical protein